MRRIIINNIQTNYSITTDGKVFSHVTKKYNKPNPHHGYLRMSLYIERKQYYFFIHRLVAMMYLDNPLNLEFINHKDHNRKNNNVENLEWVTTQQNTAYKVSAGRQARTKGSAHGRSKLTEEQVCAIRTRFEDGENSVKELSKKFDISISMVYLIIRNKNWTHVSL